MRLFGGKKGGGRDGGVFLQHNHHLSCEKSMLRLVMVLGSLVLN